MAANTPQLRKLTIHSASESTSDFVVLDLLLPPYYSALLAGNVQHACPAESLTIQCQHKVGGGPVVAHRPTKIRRMENEKRVAQSAAGHFRFVNL